MIGVIRKGSQHYINRRTVLTAAAFVMRNGDNPIDVRILHSIVEHELSNRRNLQSLVTGAHTCRHDQNVVACANTPVRSSITHERCALAEREVIGRSSVQIFGKFAHDWNFISHIVVRDLFSALDTKRSSDWLAKLQYKIV